MNLISFFQQFFRHQPDGVISMATFDQAHLMLLALTVLGCAFILNDYYLIFKQVQKNPSLHTPSATDNHVCLVFFRRAIFQSSRSLATL